MNLREITKPLDWIRVKKALLYYYPDKGTKNCMPRYEEIFNEIKKYRKRKQECKGELIKVCYANWDNDSDEDGWYNIATNKFALSLRKWRELANIKIEKETLKRYSHADIVAHFLWEITFYGYYEEDNKKVVKKLNKAVKDIKKDINKNTRKINNL